MRTMIAAFLLVLLSCPPVRADGNAGLGFLLGGYEAASVRAWDRRGSSAGGSSRDAVLPGIVLTIPSSSGNWEHAIVLPVGEIIRDSGDLDGLLMSIWYAPVRLFRPQGSVLRPFVGPVLMFALGGGRDVFVSVFSPRIRIGLELSVGCAALRAFGYAGGGVGSASFEGEGAVFVHAVAGGAMSLFFRF